MQEAEEQDTCRICSAPGEPDQPLFYPCKCSGTIRYIHQDCLTTWLSHSKKKNCDVCKYPYSFTKVYASDMPATLPPLLLIRRLAQHALFAVLFGLRAIMIGIVWLAVLPWITIWTWRVYFTMGESTAWWISGRTRSFPDTYNAVYQNISAANETYSQSKNMSMLQQITTRPFWQTLSADIFTGQIIASLIVLVFVAVFLLREWISQNARPGVFEDDDGGLQPPQDPPGDIPPQQLPMMEVARIEIPQNGRAPGIAPRVQLQIQEMQRHQGRLLRARRGMPVPPQARLREQEQEVERQQVPIHPPAAEPHIGGPEVHARLVEAQKGKARSYDEDDRGEGSSDLRIPARARRRLESDLDQNTSSSASTMALGDPSLEHHASYDSEVFDNDMVTDETESSPFQFTFRASALNRPPTPRPEDMYEPNSSSDSIFHLTSESLPDEDVSGSSASFEFVPSAHGDYSDRSFSPAPPSQPPSSTSELHMKFSPPLRRPPFPNTTVDGAAPNKLQLPPSPAAPLASPSLTTYRAPEELEPGPSRPNGYFDRKKRARDESEDEYNHFFRDPPDTHKPTENGHDDAAAVEGNRFIGDQEMDLAQDPENAAREVEEVEEDEDEEEEMIDPEWEGEPEQEEEEEEEEDDDEAELNVVDPAQFPPQAQLQAAIEQAAQVNDELEGGVEDDMDGIMEAIGLRGPVFGVVQNAVLMIFVLDTAIGFGIWLPFTLGKTTALLSLDPPRFLHLLHLPIRAMRIVTDPIVDLVTLLLGRFAFPSIFFVGRFLLRALLYIVTLCVDKIAGQGASNNATEILAWAKSQVSSVWHTITDQLRSSPSPSGNPVSRRIEAFFESDSELARRMEPYFASLGQEVRVTSEQLQASWVRLTYGHGTNERVFAITLGYVVVGLLLALYLNIFTMGNARSAGRAVRNAVRQQLLVVKVAMFIIIELVVFPLGCGLMLDACTVWVFPEATFQSRAAFFAQAPLTALFYHWVAGTMFMYQFAILLAGCRGIMRPGAMWFIKDPQDQNFHPIRDILDRPTFTQFRKLLVSALMYSLVVACGVGSIATLLFIGSKSIFPLRWKTREPLSDVPIDLLFLQFALPYTMRYLRPRKILHRLSVRVWKYLAIKLRLTSYMFGDRQPSEEYTVRYTTWTAFFLRSDSVDAITKVPDGTFRRVPASDNIALPKDLRATVEVLENGEPVNDIARELMLAQNDEAEKAKRDIKDDYITVYIPPHFRSRVIYFILAVWSIMALTVAAGIALPVQLGRRFFGLFTSAFVHDGYSFIAGFYLLWGCYVVAKAVDRMDKRRQRRSGDGPRAEFPVFFIKRSLLWVSKISYMIFFLGIVLPILLALVVDLYIIMPIRLTLDPTLVPRIRVVDMWALGLVYGKIALRGRRRRQANRIARGFTAILNNGWTHPDPHAATTEVIAPLAGGFLGMLVLPAVVIWSVRHFWHVPVSNKFMFMHAYPGIFAVAGLSRAVIAAVGVLSSWSQSIRDKEFLVEMRLQNLEPKERGLMEEAVSTEKNDRHAPHP
ncbi:hypothetical protein BV22DRAFT_1091457 [Leucogyrophana mollusca]|uniref:Uncharacterized protein n=1 Tax=Leucogyrophana mollusca TaxID=85980 RepID=A0ACB8BFW1_9AGAM|nr:hypothetical protein BV22DRAFT_1091457 [Leucogyrophana mollusca]